MLKADCRSRMIAPFSGTETYRRSQCMAIRQILTRQIPFGGERYMLLQSFDAIPGLTPVRRAALDGPPSCFVGFGPAYRYTELGLSSRRGAMNTDSVVALPRLHHPMVFLFLISPSE